MSDLFERLRRWGRTRELECVPPEKLMDEAADEIENLKKIIHNQSFTLDSQRKDINRLTVRYDKNEIKWMNIASGQLKRIAELERDITYYEALAGVSTE